MRNKKRNRTCWNSPDFLTNFYNFFPNCIADTVITKHRLVRSSTNLSRSESIIINKRLERVEKWTIRHRNERSYRISLRFLLSFRKGEIGRTIGRDEKVAETRRNAGR